MRELTAQMKAIATVVREHVSKAFSQLSSRLDAIENSIKEFPDVSPESLAKHAATLVLQDLPPPKEGVDGKDGINGEDGKSITIDDVSPLINQLVAEKVSAIPVPKNGTDGIDGKDVDPEIIQQMVSNAIAEIPVPKDGEDGKSITVEDVVPVIDQLVAEKVALIPVPKDGESIPIEQVQRMVDEAVAKALKNIPVPKNGEPGRDGADIEILPAINAEKSYPRGTFATHLGGLFRSYETTHGMKGWECIVDGVADIACEKTGDRNFNLQVTRSSGAVTTTEILSSQMIYRGVFAKGEFTPGDVVTWGGAMWHCQEPTSHKPGEIGSKGWTLCVKPGRDGKDGINGKDFTKGVSLK